MRGLYFLLVICLFQTACVTTAQKSDEGHRQQKAQRALFKRSSVVLEPPKEYAMRETKRGSTYDPKPRLVAIDEKAGRYELRWIGYDGKEKVVEYQRWDALEAVVEASAEKRSNSYVYRYVLRNLTSSPNSVLEFLVQTFSRDIGNERVPGNDDIYIGHMSTHIPNFSNGVWRRWGFLTATSKVPPGESREVQIVSKSQPGVVGCYAGAAEPTLKGAGEHMPEELEMATPGFDGLASCITIGPDERLARMSKDEKVKYLLDNLPKFVEAGWMAGDTPRIYEAILRRNDPHRAYEQAKRDIEKEYITSEVFSIIEGLIN